MLPCRLYSFVTGVVLMIVVILFGVPRDDKLHTQSSQRMSLDPTLIALLAYSFIAQ